MAKKYIVDLNKDEKAELVSLTQKGRPGARKIKRANILLLANGLRYWRWGGRGFGLGSRKNPKPEKRLKTAQNPASRLDARVGQRSLNGLFFHYYVDLNRRDFHSEPQRKHVDEPSSKRHSLCGKCGYDAPPVHCHLAI